MSDGLVPTEMSDGRIAVLALADGGRRDRIRCSSDEAAIETARAAVTSAPVAKMVDRGHGRGHFVGRSND